MQWRQVSNSADATALAATIGLRLDDGDPCYRAKLVAKANKTVLSQCEVVETTVIVEVERDFSNIWLARVFGPMKVQAKAGF